MRASAKYRELNHRGTLSEGTKRPREHLARNNRDQQPDHQDNQANTADTLKTRNIKTSAPATAINAISTPS
jgi:hypothetical protein